MLRTYCVSVLRDDGYKTDSKNQDRSPLKHVWSKQVNFSAQLLFGELLGAVDADRDSQCEYISSQRPHSSAPIEAGQDECEIQLYEYRPVLLPSLCVVIRQKQNLHEKKLSVFIMYVSATNVRQLFVSFQLFDGLRFSTRHWNSVELWHHYFAICHLKSPV